MTATETIEWIWVLLVIIVVIANHFIGGWKKYITLISLTLVINTFFIFLLWCFGAGSAVWSRWWTSMEVFAGIPLAIYIIRDIFYSGSTETPEPKKADFNDEDWNLIGIENGTSVIYRHSSGAIKFHSLCGVSGVVGTVGNYFTITYPDGYVNVYDHRKDLVRRYHV
jgi:hypothetical protein